MAEFFLRLATALQNPFFSSFLLSTYFISTKFTCRKCTFFSSYLHILCMVSLEPSIWLLNLLGEKTLYLICTTWKEEPCSQVWQATLFLKYTHSSFILLRSFSMLIYQCIANLIQASACKHHYPWTQYWFNSKHLMKKKIGNLYQFSFSSKEKYLHSFLFLPTLLDISI